MPEQRFFTSDEAYYEVLFHECAHSTGHSFRLSRKKSESKQDYAFEELVAELTSGFLCAHTGIEDACFERSAAYLADWLECLKNDKKFLLQAASMAQQATDYILGES
jgi:antirestriction protein ArdC